jgi:4-hydroxy-tetrahydrodipicolinate reductase
LGVFSFRQLVAKATKLLNNWDIEIVETHHNQKADAPSGTAKTIIEDIRQVRELNPISNRTGKRQPNEIGIVALRGGTVPGTHTVNFFGDNETITLTHQAQSRVIFAQGAIECCTIMENQKENKLFRMEDILKLGGEQC